MINVLHVTQVFLPYQGGSTIRLLRLMKASMELCDINQHVLVPFQKKYPSLPKHEVIEGINVHRVKSLYNFPLTARKLMRRYRINIIHIHNPRPFWFVRPFVFQIPLIIELHSLKSLAWYKEILARLSYRCCDKIVVLGDTAKHYLKIMMRLPKDKIVVVRNGVDYEKYNNIDPIYFSFASWPKIGYVGTLYEWQGVFELLESAKFVLRNIPSATFIFIGDGPEKEKLKKRALEIAPDRIWILNQVPPHEVPKYIASLDLFVMLRPRARNTELTLPLKIFEVGMVKVPILLSNLTGLLEAGGPTPEKFFFIQKDLSPKAVANSIIKLFSKENLPILAKKAEAYYNYLNRHDFSWEQSAITMINTYKIILGL